MINLADMHFLLLQIPTRMSLVFFPQSPCLPARSTAFLGQLVMTGLNPHPKWIGSDAFGSIIWTPILLVEVEFQIYVVVWHCFKSQLCIIYNLNHICCVEWTVIFVWQVYSFKFHLLLVQYCSISSETRKNMLTQISSFDHVRSLVQSNWNVSGWWFGTFVIFPYIYIYIIYIYIYIGNNHPNWLSYCSEG